MQVFTGGSQRASRPTLFHFGTFRQPPDLRRPLNAVRTPPAKTGSPFLTFLCQLFRGIAAAEPTLPGFPLISGRPQRHLPASLRYLLNPDLLKRYTPLAQFAVRRVGIISRLQFRQIVQGKIAEIVRVWRRLIDR